MATNPRQHMPVASDAAVLHLAVEHALAFAAAHRGRIHAYDAAALLRALDELADVQTTLADAGACAGGDPDGLERLAEVEALTLFFDREWDALPAAQADMLLGDPRLAPHAHFLRVARRMPAERQSAAEERRLADTAVSHALERIRAGSRAWT